jgi:hypothetical protein
MPFNLVAPFLAVGAPGDPNTHPATLGSLPAKQSGERKFDLLTYEEKEPPSIRPTLFWTRFRDWN